MWMCGGKGSMRWKQGRTFAISLPLTLHAPIRSTPLSGCSQQARPPLPTPSILHLFILSPILVYIYIASFSFSFAFCVCNWNA